MKTDSSAGLRGETLEPPHQLGIIVERIVVSVVYKEKNAQT